MSRPAVPPARTQEATIGRSARRTWAVAAALVLVAAGSVGVAAVTRDAGPPCYRTRSSTSPGYDGRSASRVYDWVDVERQATPRFPAGPDLPAALLQDRYVPQGLTGWPSGAASGEDLLLVSAYHDADHDKEADGPSAVFAVVADGPRAGAGAGRMLVGSGHVGGLAVYGGWLYVGTEHEIRGYRLATVRQALAAADDEVRPPDYTRASSHDVANLGSGAGRLWAGRFTDTDPSPLTSYVQTSRSSGELRLQPDAGILVPPQTQGLAVTQDQAVFSTSYGRFSRGALEVVPRGQPGRPVAPAYCFRVPSMNEGVTVLDGRLYLLFESAARTYDRGLLRPANVVPRVHSAALTDLTSLPTDGPGY